MNRSDNTTHRPHWAVIGGGLLGMTLAFRLSQRGFPVSLYEASSQSGGLASAWQLDDVVWDRFYHVILKSDTFTGKLLAELGVKNDITWREG